MQCLVDLNTGLLSCSKWNFTFLGVSVFFDYQNPTSTSWGPWLVPCWVTIRDRD